MTKYPCSPCHFSFSWFESPLKNGARICFSNFHYGAKPYCKPCHSGMDARAEDCEVNGCDNTCLNQALTVFSYHVNYTIVDSVYAGGQALPDLQAELALQCTVFE